MIERARAFGFACLRRTAILASLAALVFSSDCFAQAAALPAAGPSPATAAPVPAASPTVQEVTISSNPSLLRVPDPWWEEPEPPCATFRVTAGPLIATLELYTSGLGRSLLAETATDRGADCPNDKGLNDRITLTKDKSGGEINRFVVIKVDSKALSTPGASMQGSVVALAGTKKAGEFALKVERPSRDELWTAITWVFSILIPATVTFLIGQWVAKITARQKEVTDFREYRITNMKNITVFFKDVDAAIRAQLEHPGHTIASLIVDNNIFSKMPGPKAVELSAACVNDDLTKIVQMLKALFPEFLQPVAKLETSLQARNVQPPP